MTFTRAPGNEHNVDVVPQQMTGLSLDGLKIERAASPKGRMRGRDQPGELEFVHRTKESERALTFRWSDGFMVRPYRASL